MKKYKDIGIYDFSDYAEEITGAALFKINGGAQVENSNEGVAGAQVGDTIIKIFWILQEMLVQHQVL